MLPGLYSYSACFCAFRDQAVVGLFFTEHFPAENIIGENSDGGEKEPEYREQQAYLTEEIERKLFVVPHPPVEPQVDDTTADKFKDGDNKRRYSHLNGEREVKFFVQTADDQKADPA